MDAADGRGVTIGAPAVVTVKGTGVRITVLGPFAVELGGMDVTPSTPRLRTLLALLALDPGRVVPVGSMLGELWPDKPPAGAQATLRTYLYRLRRALAIVPDGDRLILTNRAGCLLRVRPTAVDASRFARLHAKARAQLDAGEAAAAASTARQALRLWRGDPFGLVRLGPALRARAAALADMRSAMVDLRLAAEWSEALWIPRRVRVQSPLPPSPRRPTVAGDPPFTATADRLDAGPPPAQLPPDTGDFVGRDRELALVRSALAEASGRPGPLVAVTGALGIGKTAFTVHIAHQLRHRFPDAQFYVDVHGGEAEEADPSTVLAGLLRAVGISDLPPILPARAQVFRDWTAGCAVLMVFENVTEARQVLPLLPSGPRSAVLVTSRTRLPGLPVTAEVPLKPLRPADAVALLERVVGKSRVAAEPRAALRVVRACGYHPLIVRAAAERIRLDGSARIDTLAGYLASARARAVELRYGDRALWDRMDASYRRLSEPIRAAFLALGRLPDGFTGDQARAFLGSADQLAAIQRLIADGLVAQLDPAEPRYCLPPPLRLYVGGRLQAPAPRSHFEADAAPCW
jgi:hypothetical protein